MMKGRDIIIGDVHGCSEELRLLLNKLELRPEDHVFFIGDLIDKGPDSLGVVQQVTKLQDKCHVALIIGNHEEKFLRFRAHKLKGSKVAEQMKNTEEFEELLNQLSEAEIAVLEKSFYTYYIERSGTLLLHAGIPGNVKFNLRRSISYSENAKKEFKNIGLLLMTRMLDDNGSFVGLGDASGEYFWAEKYDGSFGKVVFGHEAFIQNTPMQFSNAIGIDTGCVYEGWLSAMIIEEDGTINYASQKALRKYAEYGK